MKTCSKCKESKPLKDFHTRKLVKGLGYRSQCKICVRVYIDENIESIAAKKAKYHVDNLDRIKSHKKRYRALNKEHIQAKQLEYYVENKESLCFKVSEYRRNNKGKIRALNAKHRASKLKATPIWSEKEAIKQFYINCPEGHHVDHIVPLQGKNVRGLHVLSNLQYLTAEENLRKSNKF